MNKAMLFVLVIVCMIGHSFAGEHPGVPCKKCAEPSCYSDTVRKVGEATQFTNKVTTLATRKIISTISGGESDVISGCTNGTIGPGTVMRWTVTIVNSGTDPALHISSLSAIPSLRPSRIVRNSLDIDADGDGIFESVGLGNGHHPGGITIVIYPESLIVSVTISTIPVGGFVRYRYNVELLQHL